jgi:hypothetical protein
MTRIPLLFSFANYSLVQKTKKPPILAAHGFEEAEEQDLKRSSENPPGGRGSRERR